MATCNRCGEWTLQECCQYCGNKMRNYCDSPTKAVNLQMVTTYRTGFLIRAGSCWIGWHWSRNNRRLCINLLPFIALWIAFPGGSAP